jgi:hypothetical protein
MKKFLVLLVILAFVLVACEKETEQVTNTGGGNQQGTAPAAQQTTTTAQTHEETIQSDENSGQDVLNKIDWNSIEDGAIILLVDEFGSVEYVGAGASNGKRLFVPDKEDFLEFINNYDFELTTLEENGKTVYSLTEIKKKPSPIADGLSLLPAEVQEAFENLLENYPSTLSPGRETSSGGGTGGEVAY